MDEIRFKDIEEKYKTLKEQSVKGEIDADEMKKELKKLMVLDEQGNYWMIGGKTGKWYCYNGTDWKEKNPYEKEDAPTETKLFSSTEEDTIEEKKEFKPETEVTDSIECKICKSKIPPFSVYCTFCGANQKETTSKKELTLQKKDGELLIKSINKISFLFFLGGLGLILGVIFGAIFGIYPILGNLIYQFPVMLQETRGGFAGGLIFAAMGGIGGFIAFSIISIIICLIYDFLSYIFGGIRFKVEL